MSCVDAYSTWHKNHYAGWANTHIAINSIRFLSSCYMYNFIYLCTRSTPSVCLKWNFKNVHIFISEDFILQFSFLRQSLSFRVFMLGVQKYMISMCMCLSIVKIYHQYLFERRRKVIYILYGVCIWWICCAHCDSIFLATKGGSNKISNMSFTPTHTHTKKRTNQATVIKHIIS